MTVTAAPNVTQGDSSAVIGVDCLGPNSMGSKPVSASVSTSLGVEFSYSLAPKIIFSADSNGAPGYTSRPSPSDQISSPLFSGISDSKSLGPTPKLRPQSSRRYFSRTQKPWSTDTSGRLPIETEFMNSISSFHHPKKDGLYSQTHSPSPAPLSIPAGRPYKPCYSSYPSIENSKIYTNSRSAHSTTSAESLDTLLHLGLYCQSNINHRSASRKSSKFLASNTGTTTYITSYRTSTVFFTQRLTRNSTTGTTVGMSSSRTGGLNTTKTSAAHACAFRVGIGEWLPHHFLPNLTGHPYSGYDKVNLRHVSYFDDYEKPKPDNVWQFSNRLRPD